MKLVGRTIYPGQISGEALVSQMGISFYGGVDPETGIIIEARHDLQGQSIAGKVLVFPSGKGSTVGSYILYRLKKNGHAPLAIVNADCETIIAVPLPLEEKWTCTTCHRQRRLRNHYCCGLYYCRNPLSGPGRPQSTRIRYAAECSG